MLSAQCEDLGQLFSRKGLGTNFVEVSIFFDIYLLPTKTPVAASYILGCMDQMNMESQKYLPGYTSFMMFFVRAHHPKCGDYLYSRVEVEDNSQDEWLIAKVCFHLSEVFPEVSIAVTDADGEFVLIEAADYLPSKLTPEICTNRTFIRRQAVHVVYEKSWETAKKAWTLEDCLNALAFNSLDCYKLSPAVQKCIRMRLDRFDRIPKLWQKLHSCVNKASSSCALREGFKDSPELKQAGFMKGETLMLDASTLCPHLCHACVPEPIARLFQRFPPLLQLAISSLGSHDVFQTYQQYVNQQHSQTSASLHGKNDDSNQISSENPISALLKTPSQLENQRSEMSVELSSPEQVPQQSRLPPLYFHCQKGVRMVNMHIVLTRHQYSKLIQTKFRPPALFTLNRWGSLQDEKSDTPIPSSMISNLDVHRSRAVGAKLALGLYALYRSSSESDGKLSQLFLCSLANGLLGDLATVSKRLQAVISDCRHWFESHGIRVDQSDAAGNKNSLAKRSSFSNAFQQSKGRPRSSKKQGMTLDFERPDPFLMRHSHQLKSAQTIDVSPSSSSDESAQESSLILTRPKGTKKLEVHRPDYDALLLDLFKTGWTETVGCAQTPHCSQSEVSRREVVVPSIAQVIRCYAHEESQPVQSCAHPTTCVYQWNDDWLLIDENDVEDMIWERNRHEVLRTLIAEELKEHNPLSSDITDKMEGKKIDSGDSAPSQQPKNSASNQTRRDLLAGWDPSDIAASFEKFIGAMSPFDGIENDQADPLSIASQLKKMTQSQRANIRDKLPNDVRDIFDCIDEADADSSSMASFDESETDTDGSYDMFESNANAQNLDKLIAQMDAELSKIKTHCPSTSEEATAHAEPEFFRNIHPMSSSTETLSREMFENMKKALKEEASLGSGPASTLLKSLE